MPHYDVHNCRVKQIQQTAGEIQTFFAALRNLFAAFAVMGLTLPGAFKDLEPQSSRRNSAKGAKKPLTSPSFIFVFEDTAVFHHECHRSQRIDVAQRIAGNRHDVGVGSRRQYPDLACHIEHVGGA
jgi:hypothetical protein